MTRNCNGKNRIKKVLLFAIKVDHCYQAYFLRWRFYEHSGRLVQMWYYTIICRWLGVGMEGFAAVLVFLVALSVVFMSGSLSPGIAGLALTYALQVRAD